MKSGALPMALRILFLAAVAGGVWWGWRQEGDAVVEAMSRTTALSMVLALVCVLFGLVVTAALWSRLLTAHGHSLGKKETASVFFVGQLGKYVPGSVWSIGAQAEMGRRLAVPARSTVSVSLVFLGLHVATGLFLAGCLSPWLPWSPGQRIVAMCLGIGVGVVAMSPPLVRAAARRISGTRQFSWTGGDALRAASAMMVTWASYGLALFVLVPGQGFAAALTLVAAYSLGYVAGVAVPVAPAGLGAREAVFLALTAPTLGIPLAAALAILARALHTAADLTLALASWTLARHAVRN